MFRITALIMVLIMALENVGFWTAGTTYADQELQSVNTSDMQKSIDTVVKSVEDLKDIMTDNDKLLIVDIFNSFTGAASSAISVFGMINTTTTFLKLIGVMKDGNAEALANIQTQLNRISERIDIMDKKLDNMSNQMMTMQATDEVNARGIKAVQMMSEWHKFEHDYMEDKMDELIRRYDTMMLNHMRDWVENDAGRPSGDDEINLNKAVVWYKGGNPLDPNAKYTLRPNAVNNIEPDIEKKTVAKPDPYTVYKDDDDFNSRADKFLILDSTFMPVKGDIRWNVNTYRSELVRFFKAKLSDICDKDGNINEEYAGHYKAYRIDVTELTDEEIEQYAEDITDSVIYRINYVMINESADFATSVLKEYGEYCKHLVTPQQGIDAMMKAVYLTHAFEYEVAEDITQFCDQMMLKTGVYSMFAMNMIGMSEFITDEKKEEAGTLMCDTIETLSKMQENGITGDGRYCYVTNSVVNYAEVKMSGSVSSEYYIRGAVSGYRSTSEGPVDITYKSDENIGDSPSYVGDVNALIIAYLLRSNGQVMDHDYLNERFSKTARPEHSAMVTSLKGVQTMNTDADCLMKSHKVIGGYFYGDPEVRLNSLPKKAEEQYLASRRMVTGTVLDGPTLAMQQYKPLFGIAAYGESHWNWEVDEAAMLGGPCKDPSFKDSYSAEKTDDGIFTDTYMAHYSSSVEYNCLLSIPKTTLQAEPGPDPLKELKDVTAEINERVAVKGELEQVIGEAEELEKAKGWASDNLTDFRKAVADAKEAMASEELTVKELSIEKDRLLNAMEYYGSLLKKSQNMTVKSAKKTIKAGSLARSKKVIKAITVKNSKGKVTYKKVKVTKAKFGKYFTVNKTNGKITVKKGLKKGTYKIRVKVNAAGNTSYLPESKAVTVTVRVK